MQQIDMKKTRQNESVGLTIFNKRPLCSSEVDKHVRRYLQNLIIFSADALDEANYVYDPYRE